MARRVKFIFILLAIPLAIISFEVLPQIGFKIRDFQERYRECVYQELVPKLEKTFHVNFPSGISRVKTAKTPVIDGSVEFLVRFEAEPEIVQSFLESFPSDPLPLEVETYDVKQDVRRLHPKSRPNWSKEVIQSGKMARYRQGGGKLKIYIDTTDEKNYLVYLDGFYSNYPFKE